MMRLEEFLAEWHNTDDRILVHTSGSTGMPKPMWVEKRRMLNSARITCDFLALKPGNTALLCMPLDYIAGKMMVVRSIERGLRLTAVKPSNHPLSEFAGSDKSFDFVAMVPSQVYSSLGEPAEREILMRTRHLIIGGGAISSELQERLQTFPHAVWSSYGMTETLSHIALRRINGSKASEWYEPFHSVNVRLNEERCLVIDAPLVHEGELVTNDIAEFDEDGRRFRILGRKDNVICSGGIKIQIEEVEECLRPYMPWPYCVSKCRDEKFGETVVLLVSQADERTEIELLEVCRQVLTKYQMPKRLIKVREIPMTETRKIDRVRACEISSFKTVS